jgi:hypothetical protein
MCLRLKYEYDCFEDPIKLTLQNTASWLERVTQLRGVPLYTAYTLHATNRTNFCNNISRIGLVF